MLRHILLAGSAAAACMLAPPRAAQEVPAPVAAPPIEFTEWKLANGLTVIALPDPTTPNVMTSVWYDVGNAAEFLEDLRKVRPDVMVIPASELDLSRARLTS